MPFIFEDTKISDVKVITPRVFSDDRGYFLETYKKSEFTSAGIDLEFNQDNYSSSVKGTLRGLHYQLDPHPQAKLVRCIKGEIFDVAVDLRKKSPTFGKWVFEILSEKNKKMLFIPEGFAHGFYTISDFAEVHYKASSEYSPSSERGIIWNDNDIKINWPSNNVNLSEKDEISPLFKDAEVFK